MPKKCHTTSSEAWISEVSGNSDGAFGVDHEDSQGNFDGRHSSDPIKGFCSGTTISYTRPYSRPRYYYTGNFNTGGDMIKGSRQSLRIAGSRAKLTDDEEWVATKTTLDSKKPRSRK